MPDVAPLRLHTSVATTVFRSTKRPAWRMGDLRRQVSWLTAQAFLSNLPGDPTWSASGIYGRNLPLTVAGAASASTLCVSPCSLFIGYAHGAHNRNRRASKATQCSRDVNAKAGSAFVSCGRDTVLQHSHGTRACARSRNGFRNGHTGRSELGFGIFARETEQRCVGYAAVLVVPPSRIERETSRSTI